MRVDHSPESMDPGSFYRLVVDLPPAGHPNRGDTSNNQRATTRVTSTYVAGVLRRPWHKRGSGGVSGDCQAVTLPKMWLAGASGSLP